MGVQTGWWGRTQGAWGSGCDQVDGGAGLHGQVGKKAGSRMHRLARVVWQVHGEWWLAGSDVSGKCPGGCMRGQESVGSEVCVGGLKVSKPGRSN